MLKLHADVTVQRCVWLHAAVTVDRYFLLHAAVTVDHYISYGLRRLHSAPLRAVTDRQCILNDPQRSLYSQLSSATPSDHLQIAGWQRSILLGLPAQRHHLQMPHSRLAGRD